MTRNLLSPRRPSKSYEFECKGLHFTATVGYYEDGRPGEIFISAPHHSSSPVESVVRDMAIAASIALQHGAPLEVLAKATTRDAQGRPDSALGEILDILIREQEDAQALGS